MQMCFARARPVCRMESALSFASFDWLASSQWSGLDLLSSTVEWWCSQQSTGSSRSCLTQCWSSQPHFELSLAFVFLSRSCQCSRFRFVWPLRHSFRSLGWLGFLELEKHLVIESPTILLCCVWMVFLVSFIQRFRQRSFDLSTLWLWPVVTCYATSWAESSQRDCHIQEARRFWVSYFLPSMPVALVPKHCPRRFRLPSRSH